MGNVTNAFLYQKSFVRKKWYYNNSVFVVVGYQHVTGPPTSHEFVQPSDYGTSSSINPMQPNIPHQQIIVIGGCPECRVTCSAHFKYQRFKFHIYNIWKQLVEINNIINVSNYFRLEH